MVEHLSFLDAIYKGKRGPASNSPGRTPCRHRPILVSWNPHYGMHGISHPDLHCQWLPLVDWLRPCCLMESHTFEYGHLKSHQHLRTYTEVLSMIYFQDSQIEEFACVLPGGILGPRPVSNIVNQASMFTRLKSNKDGKLDCALPWVAHTGP